MQEVKVYLQRPTGNQLEAQYLGLTMENPKSDIKKRKIEKTNWDPLCNAKGLAASGQHMQCTNTTSKSIDRFVNLKIEC